MNKYKILFKWLFISTLIGILGGASSYIFLRSLDWIEACRMAHHEIIYLLPVSGLIISFFYQKAGSEIQAGNGFLISQINLPRKQIPLLMWPMVLMATLLTHLGGGSAGREGTALQMSAALNDQLTKIFKLDPFDRKVLLLSAVAAGFGSVFGTPLTGAVFALEFSVVRQIRYYALFPVFFAPLIADLFCDILYLKHSHYQITNTLDLSLTNVFFILLAGAVFGLGSFLFIKFSEWFSYYGKAWIRSPILRTFFAGIVLILLYHFFDLQKYQGLGVPYIQASFHETQSFEVSLLKILFTTFTLSMGFKGGEVTPLFFIGAALGSALSAIFPIPVDWLAAMGFVAVFSGATNTPLACIFMGVELFGVATAVPVALACVVAYYFSGKTSIYPTQKREEAFKFL